ncbi:MAG: HAMP domain-containing sensor histidine kinase [Byssovorax sp.]
MKGGVSRFVRRVILGQLLVGLVALFVVALFAPRLIGLPWDVMTGVLSIGGLLALLAFSATIGLSLVMLRGHFRLIRAIDADPRNIEPEDLGRLANLPSSLTVRGFVLGSLSTLLFLVPGVRPVVLDDGRAVSLVILAITILGAAAIPQYVLTRQVTVDLLERCPLEPLTMLLDTLELKQAPPRRLTSRVLLAVVAPVALMGAGAVLVAHAQLRTLTEQSRSTTAVMIARTALEERPLTRGDAGREDAIAAAAELGFISHLEPTQADSPEPAFSREPDGQLVAVVPLERGQAVIRFTGELGRERTTVAVTLGLTAVLVAAGLGALFGRALAADLVQATRAVRLLGTENVLRGGTRLAPARFALVESLGKAIEALTLRFRVFAAAQERALDARAAAQQMRGLLFASVSHDLKSPLNAILGFAELVGQEPLTSAQRESLTLITRRGRELLGLIETILDAARVEAEQLTLSPRPTEVERLVAEAIRKAKELAGDVEIPTAVEIAEDLPAVPADPAYAPRALAVIIAHAMNVAVTETNSRKVRVRATLPAPHSAAPPSLRSPMRLHVGEPERVCIEVEYRSREITRQELQNLFDRQAKGRARGLTLGLSLARSVIELHGGAVEIEGEADQSLVCRIWMPLLAPTMRPRLSTFPTLG